MPSTTTLLEKTASEHPPSRLQEELAAGIIQLLKEQGAGVGHHLVELDLCRHFGVSRTPVRGALKLLAARGVVEGRANRGFVLRQPLDKAPDLGPVADRGEDDAHLFVAIAQARMAGRLPDQCTQQEIVRLFDTKVAVVVRVLRELAELGLVERKPGNGWRFLPSIDSALAQRESYQFRMLLEPAILLQPGFKLDPAWVKRARAHHQSFLDKPWRNTLAVEFYEMNADFHEALARASGNRYMLSAMQQQNQLRRFLNYHWDYGVERVRDSVHEHLAILSALEGGDNEFAAALMRKHLASAKAAYSESDPGDS
ncbi:MAG: GntR family transcriptional regulator [Caulobacteraceae bacterium]|nr:GntR family transcriptional regulator [Caulobacteraceae bacterium]